MADELETWLGQAGLKDKLGGQGKAILDKSGADSLDELIELTEDEDSLSDLVKEGFQKLVVRKLYRAIVVERKNRGILVYSAPGPAAAAADAAPAELGAGAGFLKAPFSLLEKTVSTVPEDAVKQPSSYVAVSDIRVHEKHAQAPKPAKQHTPVLKVGAGPLLIDRFKKKATPAEASTGSASIDLEQCAAQEFPALGAGSQVSSSTQARQQAAMAERAAKLMGMAEAMAQQALEESAEAQNAQVAQRLLQRGPRQLPSTQFDRTLEFVWSKMVMKKDKGRTEMVDSPISKLGEEEFQQQFAAALQDFCDRTVRAGGPKWEVPAIEAFLLYQPVPKTRREGGVDGNHAFALITFERYEDAQNLRQWSFDWKDHPTVEKFVELQGQKMWLERPNPNIVSRAASSHASETSSQAPSVAGSDNSHSSVAPSHRNLTLLFRNIPETIASSINQRPSITSDIKKYVADVLSKELPIARDTIKFESSFKMARQAPPGGCWLTFKYSIEGKRINRLGNKKFDDGKAYSKVAFMEAYRKAGLPEKTDGQLEELWFKCEDAVSAAEKMLGKGGRPISIATYFVNQVKAVDLPIRQAVIAKKQAGGDVSLDERRKYIEDKDIKWKTWTNCTIGQSCLYVEFMRP